MNGRWKARWKERLCMSGVELVDEILELLGLEADDATREELECLCERAFRDARLEGSDYDPETWTS